MGIKLAIGLEGGVLVGEHLHPGVGHGAPGGGTIHLVGQGAGGAGAAGDIGRPGTQHSGVGALGPAGPELAHRAAVGGPDDAVGLGGDEGLVVEGEQQEGLDELGLNGGGADGEEGLPGEDGSALRHSPQVAREAEGAQIVQKALAEAALSPQVGDVLLGEAEVFDIVDDLLQTGRNGEAASVGHIAEEHVEVADLVGIPLRLKVAVAHGQFVKITQECVVHVFLHLFHNLYRFSTVIWRASITSRPLAWSAGSGPAVQEASTTISASGRAALTMMAFESTQR